MRIFSKYRVKRGRACEAPLEDQLLKCFRSDPWFGGEKVRFYRAVEGLRMLHLQGCVSWTDDCGNHC
jgi:hypothetical protein